MTVTFVLADGTVRSVEPQDSGDRAHATGACPRCGAEPFAIAGRGRRIEGHDTYVAYGHCLACREYVGQIRARVSTIFGVEEDERVLGGRCRVY